MKPFLFLFLLASLILAPALDVYACDDCREILQQQTAMQRVDGDHGQPSLPRLAADDRCSEEQESSDAWVLCPLCHNASAAPHETVNGRPHSLTYANESSLLPDLPNLSYSINKPPLA